MINPFIYIVLNGELKMSPGKASAQAVHALAALSVQCGIREFATENRRTVIVVEAENQQQMENLSAYLKASNVPCVGYIDEGVNEVSAYSVTALAVGPIAEDDEEKRAILAPFPLFPKKEKKKRRWYQ